MEPAETPDHELARERAEAVLGQIPDYIWDGTTLPVPIEEIAASWFNLHVRDVEPEEINSAPGLPTDDPNLWLAGLLLTSRKEIWVNSYEAKEWPGRRRFTICHELGHWTLHRTGQHSLFCRHSDVTVHDHQMVLDFVPLAAAAATDPDQEPGALVEDAPVVGERRLPAPEIEANTFAANLLMPADLFRRHYTHTTTDIPALQSLFGASEKAVLKRATDLIG